jgi:hypothetical protein
LEDVEFRLQTGRATHVLKIADVLILTDFAEKQQWGRLIFDRCPFHPRSTLIDLKGELQCTNFHPAELTDLQDDPVDRGQMMDLGSLLNDADNILCDARLVDGSHSQG